MRRKWTEILKTIVLDPNFYTDIGCSIQGDTDKEEITQKVVYEIAHEADVNTNNILPAYKLCGKILGLTDLQIECLAEPFQSIARVFKPKAVIGMTEVTNAETVKDCVCLVIKKAGFGCE
jgi:hypothetical protein